MTLEEYNAAHGYNNASNPKSGMLAGLFRLLLALAIMGLICWAVYKFILLPLSDAFVDTVDNVTSGVMGEGSASKNDPRGREYTHSWADMSHYDDVNVTAKFYYEVTETSGKASWGYGNIKGVVLNNSGKDVGYASIEFGLYDDNGVKHASCYDNISNLAKDAKWSFNAVCAEWGSGWSYKIEELKWY